MHYFYSPSSMTSDLSQLVPRLWPFLYHSSSVVRGSALKTIHTLTACTYSTTTSRSSTTTITTTSSSTTTTTTAAITTTQNADSNTTTNSHSVATVNLATEMIVEEKSHKFCVKKEGKDEEDEMEAEQDKSGELAMTEKEESIDGRECMVVKNSEIINEDSTMFCSVKSENDELDRRKCVSGSTEGVECPWLVPIIQQLLTHIYQRALLEDCDENLQLVFKVRFIYINVSV